jgi:hypothetical protein
MEETLKNEQSIDIPNTPLQPQEPSYFLEEKEPENEGTSSSIVKQERIVRDHATSPLNQMRDHATSPLNQSMYCTCPIVITFINDKLKRQ